MRHVHHKTWFKEGTSLFGADPMQWKFICPVCGHIASTKEWMDAGATSGAVAFSCIGRWQEGVGCDYSGGGFIGLNPVTVLHEDGTTQCVFEFALEG